MKKKFLSLMMAAAVVATTSVSAFAADNVDASVETPKEANVTDEDNQERTTEVTITGKIADDNGKMPAASFKVTVPTAANFTVTQKSFYGPRLEIKNQGPQAIEVYAQKFTRAAGGSEAIQTVEEDSVKGDAGTSVPRTSVSLKLEGQRFKDQTENSVAYLSVTNGGNGVYRDKTLQEGVAAGANGVKLLDLGAGNVTEQTGTITLEGVAGKGQVTGGAKSDKFQLTLRIKKANS